MAAAATPLAFLKRLAEVPEGVAPDVISHDDVMALRAALCAGKSDAAELWASASADGVSLQSVASALDVAASDNPSSPGALAAASAYLALLASPGCPAFSLFTNLGFGAALRALRAACAKVGSAPDDEGGSVAHSTAAAAARSLRNVDGVDLTRFIVADLVAFLDVFPLRDMPDVLKTVFEVLTEVARTPRANAAVRDAGPLAAVAMRALGRLLRPEHGETLQSAAMLMQRLAPSLLGLTGEGMRAKNLGPSAVSKGAKSAMSHAVGLVRDIASNNPVARPAVAALTRHLALRCGENADARAAAADATLVILRALPSHETESFTTFVTKLSRNAKVPQRLLATELAVAMLESLPGPFLPPHTVPTPTLGYTSAGAGTGASTPTACTPVRRDDAGTPTARAARMWTPQPWGVRCTAVLIQRASDKAPSIRAKALQGLATALHDAPPPLVALARGEVSAAAVIAAGVNQRVFTGAGGRTPGSGLTMFAKSSRVSTTTGTPVSGDGKAGCAGTPDVDSPNHGTPTCAAAGIDLPAVLRRRCFDEKAAVRKSAVAALEAAVVALASPAVGPSEEDLAAISGACSDALVSVRRQGMLSLSALLAVFPVDARVAATWLESVLPMVGDVESTVQDRCLDAFQENVIDGLMVTVSRRQGGVPAGAAGARSRLLLTAIGTQKSSATTALARLTSALSKRGALKPQLMRALEGLLGGCFDAGAAAAASIAAAGIGLHGGSLIRGAWALLAEVTAHLSESADWTFLQGQWAALTALEHGADGADCALVLRAVSHAATQFPATEAEKLSRQLQHRLGTFNLAPGAAAAHTNALIRLTKTDPASQDGGDGDAATDHGDNVPEWFRELTASAGVVMSAYVKGHGAGGGTTPPSDERMTAAVFTIGEISVQCNIMPPADCQTFIQTLVAPGLVPAAGDNNSGVSTSVVVQAHAWTSLGKLCLVSESLAKRCLPLFIQNLTAAEAPAVRNNILVAVVDLCVRYTALVDPYVLRLATCFRDDNELVRRQALSLLASLLQRDYLKWRGPLFTRFLVLLVDSSPNLASMSECLLAETVASKGPLLPYNHFIEAVFALNNCKARGAVDSNNAEERALFAIEGSAPASRARRAAVYSALLRHMSPEHRLATAAKLVTEVLAAVTDGTLPLTELACGEALVDALWVLASPEMKIFTPPKGKAATSADDDAPAGEDVSGALDGAKKRLVSSLAKRNLVEHVVPSVIELKRMLEAEQSPLLGDLMAATRFLLKDYKTELDDILIGDKQLARELLYDLRREEEVVREGVTASKETKTAQLLTLAAPSVHDVVDHEMEKKDLSHVGEQNLQMSRKTPSKSKLAASTPRDPRLKDMNTATKKTRSDGHGGGGGGGGSGDANPAITPCRPDGDSDARHSEFAGVDAAATPAAAAALATAAGDSGINRHKSPIASSGPTASRAHVDNVLHSVPKIRSRSGGGGGTLSLTPSNAAAVATKLNLGTSPGFLQQTTTTVSLKNPEDVEPELRQWKINLADPGAANAVESIAKISTQAPEVLRPEEVKTRKTRGQKRKA